MANLIPVDDDPFAVAAGQAPKLVPVEHDPFAAAKKPTVSAIAKDTALSGGVGLGKGVIGLFGTLGDLPALASYGFSYGTAKAAEKLGLLPKGKTAADFMAASEKLNKELQGPASVPSDPVAKTLAPVAMGAERFFTPARSSEIQREIENNVTGPFYKPQTTAGQYAETVGEFLPGAALGPGNAAKNVLTYGVLPGVAAEAAGQFSNQNPWARLLGGFGTTLGAAMLRRPNVAERMIAGNADNIAPAQWDAAQKLMREAEQRGVKLTPAEAIQQITGGATGLGTVQRIAESTTEGGQKLGAFMAERPSQMQGAVADELSGISKPVSRPYDIAPKVQAVGEDAMKEAERLRSRRADPYYKAAETETVNPNAIAAVVKEMGQTAATDTTGILSKPVNNTAGLLVSTPGQAATTATRTPVVGPNGQVIRYEMTPARPATEPTLATDIPNLDRARKFVRDQTELPAFAAEAIPKEQGRKIGDLLASLRDRMERNSPNFREGRQQYETASQNVVEPFANSPTGQLATAATPEAQRAILFPQNPLPNSQRAVGNAFESIANRNQELANQLLRQEIERRANTTVNGLDTAGRPDQFGGAKFARDMRDNPQFAANMDAALSRSGNDAGSYNALLDVLGATGQRQRPGSMTAFNQEMLGDMKRGGLPSLIQGAARPMARIQETAGRIRLGRQSERLAELLMSGEDGLRQIREIARTGTGNERAMAQILIGTAPELRNQ